MLNKLYVLTIMLAVAMSAQAAYAISGSGGGSYGGDAGGASFGGMGAGGADISGGDPQSKLGKFVPSCTLTASKTTITKGESTVLKVNAPYAKRVIINYGVGSVGRSASRRVSPSYTRTYKVTAYYGGSVKTTCSRKITVKPKPVVSTTTTATTTPPAVCPIIPLATTNISATATSVSAGGAVTISWSSNNQAACRVYGPGLSSSAPSGSISMIITQNSTYGIRCGAATGSVSIAVQ